MSIISSNQSDISYHNNYSNNKYQLNNISSSYCIVQSISRLNENYNSYNNASEILVNFFSLIRYSNIHSNIDSIVVLAKQSLNDKKNIYSLSEIIVRSQRYFKILAFKANLQDSKFIKININYIE